MKEVEKNIFFGIVLLIFFSSNIFALDYGECSIVQRSSCILSNGDNIIMGLSALTNAHGQNASIGTYPYVLCCNFGKKVSNLTCNGKNKLIKISALTNAHAESPDGIMYSNSVCYEDFACTLRASTCLSTEKGILSLSAYSNAHIGPYEGTGSYSNKICCSSPLIEPCTITSARWEVSAIEEGYNAKMNVTGNGMQCNGQGVSFYVYENGGTPARIQPQSVAFNGNVAIGTWKAEWMNDGLLGGFDPEYIFNASLSANSNIRKMSGELEVSKSDDNCGVVELCTDYPDKSSCEENVCGINLQMQLPLENKICGKDVACGCMWNSSLNGCSFSYSEIFSNTETGIFSNNPINPSTCNEPLEYCYSSQTCNTADNCLSCPDGQVECKSTLKCENLGDCPLSGCNYGLQLCKNSEGYYCSMLCPDGENPLTNNDGECEFYEGCSSPDCANGGADSCQEPFYCVNGMCSTVEDPFFFLDYCSVTEQILTDCGDETSQGYRTIKWTGIWSGEQSGDDYQKCVEGGEISIACPTQTQLPFFDYLELVISLIIISVIYIALILRKKHNKKNVLLSRNKKYKRD